MALCGDLFQGKERSRSLGTIESSNGLGKVISPVLGAAIGLITWYAAFIFFPVIVIPIIVATCAGSVRPALWSFVHDLDRSGSQYGQF
jgi:hypothetical protein